MDGIKCEHCGKIYSKKGIGTHLWRKHGEGKSFNPNKGYENDQVIWNKGFTKETNKSVKKFGDTMKGRISPFKGKTHKKDSKVLMTLSALKSFEEGTHATWKIRNEQSYPEKYFSSVLLNLGILDKCEREFFIKNHRSSYFLDFYFPDKKIDLEIDGSQHNKRKKEDNQRDLFLKTNSIQVFRINWKNPKTEEGKNYLKNKIQEFFNFYMRQ